MGNSVTIVESYIYYENFLSLSFNLKEEEYNIMPFY